MRVGLLTLVTGPALLPPQFLSREAWAAIEAADVVLGPPEDRTAAAVLSAGIDLRTVAASSPNDLAGRLVELAAHDRVVWVASLPFSPGLIEELASGVADRPDATRFDHVIGAWDPPGSRVLELVGVIDRLCSPGGCPWDRAQTQASLVPYLIEEAYELVEAIESGEVVDVIEELGDVLMQVVFLARLAEEQVVQPFDLDEVAGGIAEKLRRRQPGIFGVDPPENVPPTDWDTQKAREKADRTSVLDGIPPVMPVLDRATKIVRRLEDSHLLHVLDEALPQHGAEEMRAGVDLMRVVRSAVRSNVDPARQLRAILRTVETEVTRIGLESPEATVAGDLLAMSPRDL